MFDQDIEWINDVPVPVTNDPNINEDDEDDWDEEYDDEYSDEYIDEDEAYIREQGYEEDPLDEVAPADEFFEEEF